MNYYLIVVTAIFGITLTIASCKKSEEMNVEVVEDIQANDSEESGLASAMKEASRVMKSLKRAVKHNDWVQIDMWTQEIRGGIGHRCIELYKAENKWFASEFIILHEKFVNAIDKLMLCSKEHDTTNVNLEFNRLKKTCDECHAIFQDEKDELERGGLTTISPDQSVR
ncbi:MAG: hypothetical protein MRK02_14130 [Candidatus Scalindua sp.]|nr:hypothetical protein [Candidatus Scalindua sp.]